MRKILITATAVMLATGASLFGASAAENHDDLSVLARLLAALAAPYEARADQSGYQDPSPDDGNYRTFCGT